MVLAHLGVRPGVEPPSDTVHQPESVESVQVVGRNVVPRQVTGTECPLLAEQLQGRFHLGRLLNHRNNTSVDSKNYRGIIARPTGNRNEKPGADALANA